MAALSRMVRRPVVGAAAAEAAARAGTQSTADSRPEFVESSTDVETRLAPADVFTERALDRSLTAPHRALARARTILMLAAGMVVSAVARQVGRGRRIVRKWGVRFTRNGGGPAEPASHRSTRSLFPPKSPRTS